MFTFNCGNFGILPIGLNIRVISNWNMILGSLFQPNITYWLPISKFGVKGGFIGWHVFVSGVYKGAQKIMGNSTI